MLVNDGVRQRDAARWYAEALLSTSEGQGLAMLGLLQEAEHQLIGGHPHRQIQRLDHEPDCRVTVTTGQQALHEVSPELDGVQMALVAAMQ